MYETILIYLAILLVVLSIVYSIYLYYYRIPLYPYSKNTMNIEIFCVQLPGQYLLQQNNNAKLLNGYNYATDIEINNALANGMSIPGVKDGDVALYLSAGYYDPTVSPYGYITKAGDFSTNKYINFSASIFNNNATYWVFLKGYKPTIDYSTSPNMYFYQNPNIESNAVITMPWNSKQWNNDAPRTVGNYEVFLVDVRPFPSSLQFVNSQLQGGYTLATIDQINWSISRGLSNGTCANITYTDGINLVDNPIFPGLSQLNPQTNPPSSCGSSNYLAIWGIKPATPSTVFSSFASTNIQNFNSKKYSLYN